MEKIMYPMFTVLQNVVHPETREIVLHEGRSHTEERLNKLADEFKIDRLPELLKNGVVTPTKPPRN
jgi:hypothetical protein